MADEGLEQIEYESAPEAQAQTQQEQALEGVDEVEYQHRKKSDLRKAEEKAAQAGKVVVSAGSRVAQTVGGAVSGLSQFLRSRPGPNSPGQQPQQQAPNTVSRRIVIQQPQPQAPPTLMGHMQVQPQAQPQSLMGSIMAPSSLIGTPGSQMNASAFFGGGQPGGAPAFGLGSPTPSAPAFGFGGGEAPNLLNFGGPPRMPRVKVRRGGQAQSGMFGGLFGPATTQVTANSRHVMGKKERRLARAYARKRKR